MARQLPKPQVVAVIVRLSPEVIAELDKLLATGLFGHDHGDAAARVIGHWLFDHRNHPALRE